MHHTGKSRRSNADLRPDIIATSQREQIAQMRVLFEV